MLQSVNSPVFLRFLDTIEGFRDHFASVSCVEVLDAESGGYIFGLKFRRELMLKVVDLICNLLFLYSSTRLA